MTAFRSFGRLGPSLALVVAAGALALGAPSSRAEAAGPFDGSVPLVCAPIDIMECSAGGACDRRTAEEVNLPQFIHVDLKAKTLTAADGSRSAPIPQIDQTGGRTILHGGQEGRAWSMVIEGDTGRLSAGVVEREGAFVVFGACTPR